MKKLYISLIAALLMTTGCTNNKESSKQEDQEMEIEEEFDVQTEEGEVGGGF